MKCQNILYTNMNWRNNMIELPKECLVNKFIPKKTFYERVNISSTIKQEFVDKVEKIIWKYKISEDNINISKTDSVEEIEVFELILKEKYETKNIIKIITKEIFYPILFFMKYNEDFQYAIKFEENIYFSEWNNNIEFDFTAFNLEKVYENIVKVITNIESNTKNLQVELEKLQEILKMQSEITKLENLIKKEQQFNKKVELNKKILELKQKKENLESNG